MCPKFPLRVDDRCPLSQKFDPGTVVLRPEQAESVRLQQPTAGLDRIAVQLSLSPHQLVYQNMHLHLCFSSRAVPKKSTIVIFADPNS
jgi:hypothetical protein